MPSWRASLTCSAESCTLRGVLPVVLDTGATTVDASFDTLGAV